MANVQFQNTTFCRRKTVGTIQTAESMRISVKNDIVDVLSVGVDNVVNSYDVQDGEVTFYGKTAIKFLYNDGTSICSSTYNADFTASLQKEDISRENKFCFDVVTVDSKVDTNANTATLTILLEVTAFAYVCDSLPCFTDGEDIYLNKTGLELMQQANVVNLPVVLDEELVATKTISTVLLAESSVCVTDYTNVNNVLKVCGDATVRLTYISEGQLLTDVLSFKFDRELDSTDIPSNAQLKLTPHIRATKVRLNIAEDSINTDFSVEISATLCVEYVCTTVVEVATDAYGDNCDFVFQRQTITTSLPCGNTVAKKTVVGTLPVAKTPQTLINVGATVTKCTSLEKCVQVEGLVFATALYSDEGGFGSDSVELPFVQTVEADGVLPQCVSFATVTINNASLNDSLATAELCISVDSLRNVQYSVITSAEEKPFDKSKSPAIEVCLAHKGETLWELGKALHMSEEDLLAVNPEITSPLEKDARIVVYNKI